MDFQFDSIKGLSRLTNNAKKAIISGFELAKKYKYLDYLPIHLFYSLISEKSGMVVDLINKVGIDINNTLIRVQEKFVKNSENQIKNQSTIEVLPGISVQIKELLNESFVTSSRLGHVYVGTEHLLLAMFNLKDIDFVEEMKRAGIDFEIVKRALLSTANYQSLNQLDQVQKDFLQGESKPGALPFFATNMNDNSVGGAYFNITGRDKEIKRVIQILSRKTKNNPILVGEAGVGKTAIVEGFVNAIVQKKVPASFVDKKVLSIDIGSIIAGAKLRGDVEERITSIVEEALGEGDVILFIDEIHTIVGAGSAGGKDTMDIANILKPYLTNSNLSVIGATTSDEYNKYFESDSALSRRFQPVFVDELSASSAKIVIKNLVPDFEKYHNVKITDDAVDVSVDLSAKFIKDRFLPDKAIDLIDEAAASVKLGREVALQPELSDLGARLIAIQKRKDKALAKNDYKAASNYKEQEETLLSEIEDVVEGKSKIKKKYQKAVTSDLVKEILVEWTKIPIAASDISDRKLKDLGQNLKKRIIGQERVIDKVSLAIQRSHLGLSGSSKPLASFLFLGPTGVGKTELAKSLSRELFGSERLMFQINMSEYMEMHSVAKLIGSPPGYVGYQEGGQLTTFVKRKPYSVILFDEVEKAHPDTLNILLQILEEGELTDGKGLKVSLKNCIIIMTSNIGARDISSDNKLGFNISIDEIKKGEVDLAYEDMRNKIIDELKLTVRPELLNRIDLIDIFRGLNKEDCFAITKIQVEEFVVRLLSLGISLTVDPLVIEKINNEGYSKEYGGRNIRRKVQEILEDSLAQFLLSINVPRKRNKLLKIGASVLETSKVKFVVEK